MSKLKILKWPDNKKLGNT